MTCLKRICECEYTLTLIQALKMTKYEEKLKYLNWSANCSSRKVPTLRKFSLNKFKYLNCSSV